MKIEWGVHMFIKEAKKSVSFRLSGTTLRELAELAKRYQISQAQVITVLLHYFYANDDMDNDILYEWFEIARMG